jgi:hypothetical protein
VSLSSGDEVPHIFTRKSRLKPGEFLITSAKGLLQQYRHIAAKRVSGVECAPVDPSQMAMTRSIRSAGITPLQRYYGAVRP